MSEPADTTRSGDTSLRVGGFGVLRDIELAREAYAGNPPKLNGAIARARRARIGDKVTELDRHMIDIIVAAEHTLTERGYKPRGGILAAAQRIRDSRGEQLEPKIGPALQVVAIEDTAEHLIEVIAGALRALERLRIAFPELVERRH